MSGLQFNDLRKELLDAGADVTVSKNSLAKLALKELKYESLAEKVMGQSALVFADTDSVAVSKVLVKFAEACEDLIVQGGLIEGKELEKKDVKRLSDLPSREVLLSQLLATIQAPVANLLTALNAKSRELLSILKQYSEKKGS